MSGHWPLFREYPALQPVLAPVALATLPTPVQPLPALGRHAWIKRDDICHAVYGGNKIRKLEFVLPEIRRHHARAVFMLGATGTNAGIATSMVCTAEGIPCTVIAFPQPDSPTVQKNQAWMRHFGTRFEHRSSLWGAVLRYYLHPARLQAGNFFLFAGCSTPASTFGYINAAFEVREQIEAGLCPCPAEIIVPVSSASTLAGLTLGMALAGLPVKVTGIRVTPAQLGPFAACTPAVVEGLAKKALDLMQPHCPSLPLKSTPAVHMSGDYLGDGYGHDSAAARQAIAAFGREGITLESTYSGKAAAAFLDRLGATNAPLLFWNTFNSRPLPAAETSEAVEPPDGEAPELSDRQP